MTFLFQEVGSCFFLLENLTPKKANVVSGNYHFHHVCFPPVASLKQSDLLTEAHAENSKKQRILFWCLLDKESFIANVICKAKLMILGCLYTSV